MPPTRWSPGPTRCRTWRARNPLEVLLQSQMICTRWRMRLPRNAGRIRATICSSALVHAEVDGDRLTDAEVAAFFVLLAVAGNDTTRQTTSHALEGAHRPPDQRAWLMADFDDRIGGAVEEFVRWATPVMTFRRTAAVGRRTRRTTDRGGEQGGDVLCVGNWDTDVFDRPDVFDLNRKPNPHLASVAVDATSAWVRTSPRTQLRAIFPASCCVNCPISPRENRHICRATPCTPSGRCRARSPDAIRPGSLSTAPGCVASLVRFPAFAGRWTPACASAPRRAASLGHEQSGRHWPRSSRFGRASS